MKSHVHVHLWLDFMSQGSKFRSDTHTFQIFYTLSVTHPTARTQDKDEMDLARAKFGVEEK